MKRLGTRRYDLAQFQLGNQERKRSVNEGFPVVLLAEEADRCSSDGTAGTDARTPGGELRAVEEPITSRFTWLGTG